jgi:hypothetical protein
LAEIAAVNPSAAGQVAERTAAPGLRTASTATFSLNRAKLFRGCLEKQPSAVIEDWPDFAPELSPSGN